jgi:hypothetical protein
MWSYAKAGERRNGLRKGDGNKQGKTFKQVRNDYSAFAQNVCFVLLSERFPASKMRVELRVAITLLLSNLDQNVNVSAHLNTTSQCHTTSRYRQTAKRRGHFCNFRCECKIKGGREPDINKVAREEGTKDKWRIEIAQVEIEMDKSCSPNGRL